MDLDLALLNDKPTAITDKSSEDKNTIPQTESAKEHLRFLEERFHSVDKTLAGTLMAELTTMKFDGSHSMQNHIIEMTNIEARLRTLGDKWDVSEFSSMHTQEESRLKTQGGHSINLMGQGASK
ncbi:hypothetical protein KY285_023602 [Solanum tuberosum]|nr:hypothetical protein KY289_023934 [Solanum tuberosum]KAH0675801.1 hypothetical protein KY285_023602 [Solanum tuberosum]